MPRKTKTTTTDESKKLPPDVKVVQKKLSDGSTKTYYYRRSTNKPIYGEPGTMLFRQSWEAAGQKDDGGSKVKPVGELTELIRKFKQSPEATKATELSIKERNWYLGQIEDRFGYMTLTDIQDDRACQEIYEWRDGMSKTPHKADKAVQILNQFLKWAKARKIIKVNQAEDVGKLIGYRESQKLSRAKLIFTPEMEAHVLKEIRPCLKIAFRLALYTGARQLDLCRFRWDMIDDEGWLVYTPSKTRNSTGVQVHLPTFALPPLKALLDSIPREKHGYILSTDFRMHLNHINLRHMWAFDRDHFTECDLHWHDIRGTTVTRLLNAGCTHPEAAAITGHALSSVMSGMSVEMARSLSKYATPTRVMALNAYRKWTEAEFLPKVESNVHPIKRNALGGG